MRKSFILLLILGSLFVACQSADNNTIEEEEELDKVDDMVDRDQQAMDSARRAILGDTSSL